MRFLLIQMVITADFITKPEKLTHIKLSDKLITNKHTNGTVRTEVRQNVDS